MLKNAGNDGRGIATNIIVTALEGIRKQLPPKSRQILTRYGDAPILGALVGRHPIAKTLSTIINWITLGNLEKNARRLGYDQIYHLYLLLRIQTQDGIKILKLHKEEVPSIELLSQTTFDQLKQPMHEGFTIATPNITLGEWVQRTERHMGDRFIPYDSINNNCQTFVVGMLEANDIKLNQAQKSWIVQDAWSLISKNSLFKDLFKRFTTLGSLFHRVINGSSLGDEPLIHASGVPLNKSETLGAGVPIDGSGLGLGPLPSMHDITKFLQSLFAPKKQYNGFIVRDKVPYNEMNDLDWQRLGEDNRKRTEFGDLILRMISSTKR